ncbi:MAG: M14 family zinc carboxypeptidase [Bacteriovorax sp.]|nr:M14 family zinc carboxypeptidase [Bacteriovorax sp.]
MKSRHSKILSLLQTAVCFLSIVFSTNSFSEVPKLTAAINTFCKNMDVHFKKYNWDKSNCEKYDWIHVRNSVLGEPLTWTVFGDVSDEEKPTFKQKDISIIMCGVHGDEITPIKFCFDIMAYLKEIYDNPEVINKEFSNKIVIVAPLVNPDSFFKARPSRINARGVDVNRNFPTKDWARDARRLWIANFRKDKRRNPGFAANSEPEVIFQMNLIKRYGPDKIISVHSPLTMLDYDGPNTIVGGLVNGAKAHELLIQMSKDASDYKIENYPFFPGSLGNWAGKERDIPTYTLELPTSDPSKSEQYWKLFKSAIHNAIAHDLKEKNSEKINVKSEEKPDIKTGSIPVGSTTRIEDNKASDNDPSRTESVN